MECHTPPDAMFAVPKLCSQCYLLFGSDFDAQTPQAGSIRTVERYGSIRTSALFEYSAQSTRPTAPVMFDVHTLSLWGEVRLAVSDFTQDSKS